MMDGAANLRRGVLIPSIAAASAFAVLLSLGLWQLDRKAWKEGLIATIGQRLSAPPVALPAPATWPRLRAAEDEFLQGAVSAEFLNDREALVYTNGSSLREATNRPGHWGFTPARLADRALGSGNRGLLPEGQ